MSIDMILGSARSQTNSIKSLTTKQIASYEEVERALFNFVTQTHNLKGVTYDSAKAYCSSVLTPVIRGSILLDQAIARSNEQYINTYTGEVHNDSLKQSDLERAIEETKSQIAFNERLLNEHFEQDTVDLREVSNLQDKISSYRKIQHDLEEKLRKLLAFNAKSPSIFQEIESLKNAVDQGMVLAEKSWNPASKSFTLPSREDMEWVNVINDAYPSRDGLTINEISKDHIVKDFMVNYGFDREAAESLYKLQENILKVAIKENWSNSKIIHEYNRIIASLAPKSYVAFRFKVVAGTFDYKILLSKLKKYGFSEDEDNVKNLIDRVTDQHQYATYKDYAHEAVQLSTFTNPSIIYSVGGIKVINTGHVFSKIVNADLDVLRLITPYSLQRYLPLSQGKIKMNTKEEVMFKLKNWSLESKEISYKGDIDSGRYDDGDFNSDLDSINTYNLMLKANKKDIFKVQTQYNFRVKNNTINRVSEFYKVHGYGNYEQGKKAVQRIVDTDTIAKRYISSAYNKEQQEKHKKDFFDYLERGRFKNVE